MATIATPLTSIGQTAPRGLFMAIIVLGWFRLAPAQAMLGKPQ